MIVVIIVVEIKSYIRGGSVPFWRSEFKRQLLAKSADLEVGVQESAPREIGGFGGRSSRGSSSGKSAAVLSDSTIRLSGPPLLSSSPLYSILYYWLVFNFLYLFNIDGKLGV